MWNMQIMHGIHTESDLESSNKSCSKLVISIKHLKYKERLQKLKLPTLHTFRRIRGDIIEVYKILTNK